MNSEHPITYSPENEPYLGRESLHAFDKLIVACLEVNSTIAPTSYCANLTALQKAATQIIPQGISLALSIRELIRQGYLFGAVVLIRPLVERAAILRYVAEHPDGLKLWEQGWRHRERPSLSTMLNAIGKQEFPDIGAELTRPYNSLTHGDPGSSKWNLVELGEVGLGYSVSKMLNNPALCDNICAESATWLSIFMVAMLEIFPSNSAG